MSKNPNEHGANCQEGGDDRDEIYNALVARSGRMGSPLTLGDLDRGLLGEEGRNHASQFRNALAKACVPYDEDTTTNL